MLAAPLQQIQEAAQLRNPSSRQANPELVQAIQAARAEGWTLAEIGEVLGCSRQAIQQLLARRS